MVGGWDDSIVKEYNHFNERQAEMTFTVEYEQEEDGRWLAGS